MTTAREKGVLETWDRMADSIANRRDECLERGQEFQADMYRQMLADHREARATVAEYERVLARIANKEGDFHNDNDALDRYADEARTALARANGESP